MRIVFDLAIGLVSYIFGITQEKMIRKQIYSPRTKLAERFEIQVLAVQYFLGIIYNERDQPRFEELSMRKRSIQFKMADKLEEKITRIRKERSFPEIPGVPNRSELMKPLIFPNSQRGFKIFTYLATLGAGLYCVFIPEYDGDHCFVPIREWVQKQKGKFLKIRPEDEEYVKQRTAEMAEKVAMATKQTAGEAGENIGKS